MSQSEESIGSPKLFQRDGIPPIQDLLPTSLQHVLACFAGAIAPAMMIASTCNFTPEQEQAIIQVALILTALDTLLQQFPIFGRIGSNLPIITGVSFAFLPAFQAIGFEFGFGAEIGISTQKLHARGPMGLTALTTTKYIIYGNGQVR